MKRLHGVFGSRRERRRESLRRRRPAASAGGGLRAEALERRALLAVTVPPDITSDIVELDDNVLVAADVGGKAATIEATAGYVQIFGNSRGRIDAVSRTDTSSLTLKATSAITVTGAIGSVTPFDSLTLTASATHPVNLQQAVTLDDDLVVTQAGSVTFGSTLVVGDDLEITQAANVLFSGNVTVVGDLTITSAAAVTFSGTLTVGGSLRIVDATGAVRFLGDVSAAGADITSRDRVIAQAGFRSTGAGGTAGDVSFTTDQVGFNAAIISTSAAASGVPTATLTVKPRTTTLPIMVASPPGVPTGLLITDAAISAIQAGWKRVVFGDEAAGTGAVTVGSIGSQHGFSQLLNTTTIVGGSITVVQPVDVTSQAAYLDLVARSSTITVKKPINQTADERNDWVRLTAAGAITLEAPVWAAQTVSLASTLSSVAQSEGFAAAITAPSLAVTSGGAVYLTDSGNAFDTVAIMTTGGDVVLREDSGYGIGEIETTDASRPSTTKSTVTGIKAGVGTVRLVTVDAVPTPVAVTQTKAILAGALGLEGADTDWTLSRSDNDVDTLAAAGATGSVTYRDADDLTIGTVAAAGSRAAIAGIAVARTADVTAGTTLTLDATGDIVAGATSGTAVTLAGATGIVTSADVTTSGGDALFKDATRLAGDVVIDVVDGANTGLVTFLSTVDGTSSGDESLTVTGNLDAAKSLGDTTALQSLSVSGDSTLADGIKLRTVGDQTFSGEATSAGTVTVQAGSGATVKFLGDTTLKSLITSTTDTADYAVVMTGAKSVITDAVTFTNTGTVTLGDGASDDLWFKGGVESILPSGTSLGGTIRTTDAAATFGQKTPVNHAITLLADTIVSTGSGSVTFSGTVDGAASVTPRLVVNASGDTTFSSAVGGTRALAHLETDAAGSGKTYLDGGAVTTASPTSQVYNDPVVLGVNTTLTANGGGAVTFNDTLDGGVTLAVNTSGATTFNKAVGGGTALVSLVTDAGGSTTINGGMVKTSGVAGQTYGDAVVIGVQAATLTAGVGTVTFNGTVDSAADAARGLTVTALGLTTFNGAVGATKPLDSLTVDGAGTTAIDGGSVTTSGSGGQVYKDAVTIGKATVLSATGTGPVTFEKTLTGAYALSVTAAGDTTFGDTVSLESLLTDGDGTTAINGGSVTTSGSGGQVYKDAVTIGKATVLSATGTGPVTFEKTLTGAYALSVTAAGDTTFGDTVSLESLLTDGDGTTAINGGSVTTSGSGGQVYKDAVTIGKATVLSATGTGPVTFEKTLTGAYALTVTAAGDTTFGGTVSLESLLTDGDGTTAINGGSVTTTGTAGQVYKDAVTIGKATVLSATGTGPVTFEKTLTGPHALTVTAAGATTFGGTVSLESLLTDGDGTTASDGGSITTSGSAGQVYKDAVTIGKATVLSATGTGPVTFEKTLTGPHALTVTAAGDTTFGDSVSLESLLTDGDGTTAINGGSVATTGTAGQVYKDAVTIGKATVLSATGTGPVTFEKTLTGAYALTVTAAGDTTFGDSVSLESLLTDGSGTTAINGGSVATTGTAGQVYKDAVTLGKATVLSATGTGPVTFEKTLTGPHALTVTAAGDTTFGDTVSLESLLTDGTGTTAIDGGSITTSGAAGQVYKDAVTIGKATVLLATGTGPVTFEKTLTGPHALTVTAAGTTTFGGTVSLESLLTDGDGTTAINGGSVTTSGLAGQVYKDDVTIGKATVLSATGAGPVTFEKTLTGPHALTVTAAGTTTFGDTVSLESLLTDGDGTTAIDGGSVATTGAAGQVYKDAVTLGKDTTLTGDTITTLGTVTGGGHDLTIAGDATLGDAAADVVTGVASLTVTGLATVNTSQVAASERQTWKKTVTLGTDATFENGVLSFEDPIVGGGYDLTLTGSSVILGDAPTDSVTGVDDLLINGPTDLNGNTITTTGTQTFNGGVTAVQATAVVLSGKGINFKQSLGRGEPGIVPPLTITAGTGGVTFGGDAGSQGRPFGTTEIRSEGGVSLAGTLSSNGPVTVASTKGSITGGVANAIRTPDSTIRLEAATGIGTQAFPIGIEAVGGVTAATTTGGIFLRAVEPTGNLWIGPDGLVAQAGPIGLDARNAIGVLAGGRIQAGAGVTAPLPISWSITTTADGGPGSLRQVLLNVNEVGNSNRTTNANGLDARLSFDMPRGRSAAPLVFSIATPLPELRAAVEIIGFGIVFSGTGPAATNGLVLGAAASGSTLQGLTLEKFRDYAIQLRSAQNVTVDRVTVRGLNLITSMGVYATGNLAGTVITGGTFTGGLRGALLDGARGLRVVGNTFADNRSVSTQPNFAGTGIRAQGDCTGTVVQGNTFTGNNYGFAFMGARGLALRNNSFARNNIAGIYIEGDCSGSTKSGNTFATANGQRNRVNIARTRTSRGA